MYKIQKLDDNQLENITGGMDCLIYSTYCFLSGLLSCCLTKYYTGSYLRSGENEITEQEDSDDDIIEIIPVSNIKYNNRRYSNTAD